jgi:hypothetical protein
MDPNATLNIIIDRAESIIEAGECGGGMENPEATELAEAVLNLHKWLSTGSALPRAWRNAGD